MLHTVADYSVGVLLVILLIVACRWFWREVVSYRVSVQEARREQRIRLHPEILTSDDFQTVNDSFLWQSMHPSARVVDIRTKAAKQGKHFRAGYTVNR